MENKGNPTANEERLQEHAEKKCYNIPIESGFRRTSWIKWIKFIFGNFLGSCDFNGCSLQVTFNIFTKFPSFVKKKGRPSKGLINDEEWLTELLERSDIKKDTCKER